MKAQPHYTASVLRDGYMDRIIWRLICAAPGCRWTTAERPIYRRTGDRSGLGGYNRMRAEMLRHWRDNHA